MARLSAVRGAILMLYVRDRGPAGKRDGSVVSAKKARLGADTTTGLSTARALVPRVARSAHGVQAVSGGIADVIHLTIHQLSSYIDRELPMSSTELVRRHLESCEECTRRFSTLQEQEAILNRILVHDPGAAFFVLFPGLVLEEAAKARESARGGADRRAADRRVDDRRVTERRVGGGDRRGTGDRREVASGAGIASARPIVSWKPVAPEEVVASGATPAEREATARRAAHAPTDRVASDRREEPSRKPLRSHARTSQPAIPWFAALILCVVVGALTYVLPRPGSRLPVERPGHAASESPRGSSPAPEKEPSEARSERKIASVERGAARDESAADVEQGAANIEQGVTGNEPGASAPPDRAPARVEPLPPPAPANDVVPVRRFITTTEAAPERPPATAPPRPRTSQPAPRVKPDEFAAAAESARPLVVAAQSASRAAVLDSSAANLDAAADAWDRAIPSLDGALQTAARRNLADARCRAWLAAPDPYRAANATAALRAYLVFAPPGPGRDAAKAWLLRISGRP